MKSRYRWFVLCFLISIVLLGSLSLNFLLYHRGRQYYVQLNGLRLDPLGLSYYSTAPNQQDPSGPDLTKLVFFGDSRAADWPSPDLEGFEFVNRGIDSETSVQAVQRFDYHLKPLKPQVVIIQIGVNDLKTIPLFPEQKQAIIDNCQENIRQVAERSMESGAQVILTTIFPTGRVPIDHRQFWSDDVGLAIDEVNTYIRSLGGGDVLVLDAYSVLLDDAGGIRPEYSQDFLHLRSCPITTPKLCPLIAAYKVRSY